MDFAQWLTENPAGELFYTFLIAMLPVVELRGAIPVGVGMLGRSALPSVYLAAVLGNMLPVPFIIVYIRRIFQWLRRRSRRLDGLVTRLETKAHLKGRMVTRYKYLGLCILVAIPLPGTGAWTGALVAAFLDMRLRSAVPAIFLGVVIAGILVSLVTGGVIAAFF
ncbi:MULTISPECIES: COG2426 family protein [Intestinimonas]|uniref:COG2426 family protein n=1 Tax=Intestinimonas TaxID=1392389 RepID=UPI0006C58571|nr:MULTISPECIES: small multi-drug export protein [Intestinimonas]CUQ20628.1 membrane protein [Flavonifractor plautii]SCJ07903.1 Predicted membrane protein [uncultured Flavonifractor sp.]BDE88757.1 multidrug SMR transporter [Oscillospiraceae bacterium]MCI5562816.1 small multi-drug export protein [Intestinimonas massiliensis (ex Afouda et al. 2020)]MDY5340132.1 small multi-drug export protein [Intestinimonas sp.]